MPTMAAVFFLSMVALLGALYTPVQEEQANTALADAASTSFLAYRESVINYLNATPGFTGVVPDTSLTYLWGYQRDTRWTNIVTVAGSLYVYESTVNTPNTSTMLDQLYRKTANSFMVGRNASGSLVSANGFATGVTVSPAVPNGALVIAGK